MGLFTVKGKNVADTASKKSKKDTKEKVKKGKVKKEKVKKPKKGKKQTVKDLKFKTPIDVKFYYVLPIMLVIGVFSYVLAGSMFFSNVAEYNQKVLKSSMSYGTKLPLWGGKTSASLELGHTILSKDGKDLAVEVKYDDVAHSTLSSFGDNYILRLVVTKENQMKGVSMKYGMFSTDGSGVLMVHSDNGFKNKAFIVMLVDRGYLINSNQLTSDLGNTNSDESDLDKSITAQLTEDATNPDGENKLDDESTPPIFYMRLNAHNAKRVDVNLTDARNVVNELFVSKSVNAKKAQLASFKKRQKSGQRTLEEMQKRLEENPNDSLAQEKAQSIQTSLDTINAKIVSLDKNIQELENSKFKKDIFKPMQTKYERFMVSSLDIRH